MRQATGDSTAYSIVSAQQQNKERAKRTGHIHHRPSRGTSKAARVSRKSRRRVKQPLASAALKQHVGSRRHDDGRAAADLIGGPTTPAQLRAESDATPGLFSIRSCDVPQPAGRSVFPTLLATSRRGDNSRRSTGTIDGSASAVVLAPCGSTSETIRASARTRWRGTATIVCRRRGYTSAGRLPGVAFVRLAARSVLTRRRRIAVVRRLVCVCGFGLGRLQKTSKVLVFVARPTNLVQRRPQTRHQRGVLVNPSGASQALDHPTMMMAAHVREEAFSGVVVQRAQSAGPGVRGRGACKNRRSCLQTAMLLPTDMLSETRRPRELHCTQTTISQSRNAQNGRRGGSRRKRGGVGSSHGQAVRAMVGERVR